MLALSCGLAALLVACTAGAGGDSAGVKLVVTPVPTATHTPIVPPTAAPTTYTVKPGDTLSGVAALFGVTVDDIVRANNIADPNVLADGQVLTIPARSGAGAATATPVPAAASTPTQGPGQLPPPDVTPPLGPTTGPGDGAGSDPESTISPTAAP